MFAELGAVVLGVSFDPVEANQHFANEQQFTFALLSDADRMVGDAYGVVRPADHKWHDLARRFTFLIDPDRIVRRVYDVSDVARHADEVLADLQDLTRG